MQTNYTEETQPLWRLLEEPGFHFVVIAYNDRALVRQLRLEADQRFPRIRQRTLSGVQTTYENIIQTFNMLQKGIVWITDFDLLLDNQYAYPELNNRRDLLAEKEISLVVFLPKSAQGLLKMTQRIPDLWSFRNLTLDLISEHPQEYPGTSQGLALATHSTPGSPQAIAASANTELSQHIQQEQEAEYQSLQSRIKSLDHQEVGLRISWLSDLAKLATELRYFEEALAHYVELLTHAVNQQDEAYCWIGIGNVYANKTQYRQAIDWYLKALPALEANADANVDVQLANLYNELGNSHHNLRKVDKAINYYKMALVIDLQVYGEAHPYVAECYNNLGLAYDFKGELDKALWYYEKALAILIEVHGEAHPNVATTYNNLGGAYDFKSELDKALWYYEKALTIDCQVYGEAHPSVATRYNNLGGAYKSKGELDNAIAYFEKALAIDLKVYGEEHPDTAIVYNNLGEAYRSKGELDKAIRYYKMALSIDLQVFGEVHSSVAREYNNLGSAYEFKGELDKAIEYYKKALFIEFQVYGKVHPSVARAYNNLGSAYRSKYEPIKAISYLQKSLLILINTLGNEHPNTTTVYSHLKTVLKEQGRRNPDKYIKRWLKSAQSKT